MDVLLQELECRNLLRNFGFMIQFCVMAASWSIQFCVTTLHHGVFSSVLRLCNMEYSDLCYDYASWSIRILMS
jgi:hypothetical protein